jgi:hypothetical protein
MSYLVYENTIVHLGEVDIKDIFLSWYELFDILKKIMVYINLKG